MWLAWSLPGNSGFLPSDIRNQSYHTQRDSTVNNLGWIMNIYLDSIAGATAVIGGIWCCGICLRRNARCSSLSTWWEGRRFTGTTEQWQGGCHLTVICCTLVQEGRSTNSIADNYNQPMCNAGPPFDDPLLQVRSTRPTMKWTSSWQWGIYSDNWGAVLMKQVCSKFNKTHRDQVEAWAMMWLRKQFNKFFLFRFFFHCFCFLFEKTNVSNLQQKMKQNLVFIGDSYVISVLVDQQVRNTVCVVIWCTKLQWYPFTLFCGGNRKAMHLKFCALTDCGREQLILGGQLATDAPDPGLTLRTTIAVPGLLIELLPAAPFMERSDTFETQEPDGGRCIDLTCALIFCCSFFIRLSSSWAEIEIQRCFSLIKFGLFQPVITGWHKAFLIIIVQH